jgi:hypothetical protein
MKNRRFLALVAVALLVATLALFLRHAPEPKPAPAARTTQPAPPLPSETLSPQLTALGSATFPVEPRERARAFGAAFQKLLAADPAAALTELRRLPPGSDRDLAIFLFLDALHRHDPERALALARELVTTREQAAIYGVFFDTFARENPVAASQRLALVPSGSGRENALRALASVWAAADTPAALAWAQSLADADRVPALESALNELALRDPLQVIDLAQRTLNGPALERTLFNALQKITAVDPAAAAGLVSLLPPGDTQTRAALAVARGLAEKNPPAALAFVATLPAGPAQILALNNVLTAWAAAAPAAAGRYIAALAPGAAQDTAAGYLAAMLAAQNPQNALAWAQALPADSARSAAFIEIASTWAQKDPAAATRWASAQPAHSGAETALAGALSYWLLRDPAAARDFVTTLPAATQPAAAASIAPQLAQRDPAATLAWAQALAAPAARDAATTAAYLRWLDNTPAAARDWLATAILAPDLKTRLSAAPAH